LYSQQHHADHHHAAGQVEADRIVAEAGRQPADEAGPMICARRTKASSCPSSWPARRVGAGHGQHQTDHADEGSAKEQGPNSVGIRPPTATGSTMPTICSTAARISALKSPV
jgi:hypothetical protein